MSILNELNEEQRQAAEQINGPVLILAGAGSGKTRTVTYRIAHMVRELGISPLNILALTFTNKAAKEMKERAENLVGAESHNLVISTFHSFAVRLLKTYADRIGYGRNFNIYDVDDQKSLITKIIKELNYNIDETPGRIANKISKLKEDGIGIKELEKEVDVTVRSNKIFYEIYKSYDNTLRSNNAMDFSDLLLNTRKILDDPYVLDKVQERYKYVIVDEYQDTNNIQYEIINIISSKYRNICVVGDEDQSIYAFRGANIHNILNFERDYKDALVVKLERNYRSTKRILNAANEVIKNNKSSKGKKLWTDGEIGEKIKVYRASTTYDESNYIIDQIKKKKENGIQYKDMTILYRTNAQSRVLEEKLLAGNIKYKIYGGMQFFQRKEIKDILGYLSLLNNSNDNLNFLRIINIPKRSIGDKTIEKLNEIAYNRNISLFDSLKYINEISGLRASTVEKLNQFYNMMYDIYESLDEMTIKDIFDEILEKTDYINSLEDNKEDRIKNIEELLNSITEMQKENPALTLSEYLDTISLSSATDDLEDDENYVKLMTVHSSKGLEFDYVFIAGMEDGLFPSDNGDATDDEIEEERRLCYVAVTRARKELYISHAEERMIWGQTSYMRRRSRFIEEMNKEELDILEEKKKNHKSSFGSSTGKIENFNPFKNDGQLKFNGVDLSSKKKIIAKNSNSKYKLGEYVTHKSFGRGKITGIDEKSLTVDFMSGEKKIALVLAEKFLIE